MKIIRIVLLILIILGLGLLATQAYWVPSLVQKILSTEKMPTVVAPQVIATSTKAVTIVHHAPSPTAQTSGSVYVTADIGPTCPVVMDTPDAACADKPYQTTLVLASTIIGRNGGVLVKTDSTGHFTENLAPGTYTIRAQSTETPLSLTPVQFTIKAGERTDVKLEFDSGIR